MNIRPAFRISRWLQLSLYLAVTAAVVVSCGRGGGFSLRSTNFKEVVEPQQNLVFRFEKDIAPKELVGDWRTNPYIAFEPQVPGRFRWTAPDELVFSPATAFAPNTDYTAYPTQALMNPAEGTSDARLAGASPIRFHTPYLDIVRADAYWGQQDGRVVARVAVSFNYPVAAAEVKSRISARLKGKETQVLVEERPSQDTDLQLTLPIAPDAKDDEINLELEVAEGLTCLGSTRASTERLRFKTAFPTQELLIITHIEPEHDGQEGSIRIYTSQALKQVPLARFIKVTPEVSYTAQATDNGLVLKGAFSADQSYELTLKAGLPGILGKDLEQDYNQTVAFGEVGERIQFASGRGSYLPGAGSRQVGIRLAGVKEVSVKVYKIYANNLLAFLRQGSNSGYYYGEEEGYDEPSAYSYYYDIESYGDLILERTYEAKTLPRSNGQRLLDLNFTDTKADFKGIYLVEVSNPEKYYLRANKVITVSDVGLIARVAHQEVYVFTNSLATTDPLEGVAVQLVSTNNQTILTAQTDARGVAVFKDLPTAGQGFKPGMITAQRGEGRGADFSYLHLQNNRIETSRFSVGGKGTATQEYDGYLYSEREMYRPGDSVHVQALVRKLDWTTEAGMPVTFKVTLPNGREMLSRQVNLSGQGSASLSFGLDRAAPTGSYGVSLYTGAGALLYSMNLGVEEFVPDRMRVNTRLKLEELRLDQDQEFSLTAEQLYGAPAAGRDYEIELTLRSKYFSPKGYENYDFSLAYETKFESVRRSGKTDAQGQATETLSDFETYRDLGVLQGRVFATVFDETGRPINRSQQFTLYTQPVLYGLGRFDYYVDPNTPLNIPLVAVDAKGQATAAPVRLQVMQHYYETVIEQNYGRYQYRSQRRTRMLVEKTLDVPREGRQFVFTPRASGTYEVRLLKPGSSAYVGRYFYSYGAGWGGGSDGFEVNPDGQIDIVADKDAYEVGQEATLIFKAPFEGRLLVTYEQNGVRGHEWLRTSDKAAKLTLKLRDEHLPNVFVTATLIRPMDGTQLPLMVAHGFQNLVVKRPDRQLPVTIAATDKSTSRTQQEITVTTRPGAEVTIAVVDEGIMQLRNSATPNPYDYFYGVRALAVSPHDMYAALLPELGGKTLKTGGDGYDLGRRVNPVTDKRFKLVRFWSRPLRADGEGKVRFTINIPQFAGELRIMAVAAKDQAFGSADKPLKVADPVVISTALPRFLTPGDSLDVPVTLANTTTQGTDAVATLKVSGPVKVIGPTTARLRLGPNEEGRVLFRLGAGPTLGGAKIELAVQAMGRQFTEETDVPVRPGASLVKESQGGQVTSGQTATLDVGQTSFLAGTRTTRLVVSRNPLVEFSKNLSFLLGYPHGCVEQTVSKAFPQLYYQELVKAIGAEARNQPDPDADIQAAISKLQTFQLYSGGMSMWQGGQDEEWWGSVYAAHFLTEARKAGYTVPPGLLSNLLNYLARKSAEKTTDTYYNYDGTYQTYARREILYGLYVLALNGRAQLASLNYYKSNLGLLTPDSKYLLAAAYALAGDKASFRQMLPPEYGGTRLRPESGGSYASPIRDRGMVLLTLLETDPQHSQIGTLARDLSQAMKGQQWLSTQEAAFSYLALGKFAKLAQQSSATATVTDGGRTLGTLTDGKPLVLQQVQGTGLKVQARGGTVYYFWESDGIPASGRVTEGDNGLRVRRTYYNRDGKPLTTNRVRQGDLVVVRLALSSTTGDRVENVVVTDLLPAGLEIENPRVSELPELKWVANASYPRHTDIRDDRINYYTTLYNNGELNYYYVARAVSQGSFTLGPASADAMYRADLRSYSGAGTFTVYSRDSKIQ